MGETQDQKRIEGGSEERERMNENCLLTLLSLLGYQRPIEKENSWNPALTRTLTKKNTTFQV
jgi:hypothetical protein